MGTAKKVIGTILEATGEFVKDSGKQVAEAVNPVKMMEWVLGINKPANEFSDYLKNLGGNLSEADIEKRKKEFEDKKTKEMEEAQKVLRQALPDHLKPKLNREPSIFEKNKQEEEMKKAQMVEAQKKQPKSISAPQGKVTGVLGGKKRKPQSSQFESAKNVKIG